MRLSSQNQAISATHAANRTIGDESELPVPSGKVGVSAQLVVCVGILSGGFAGVDS